MYENELQAIIKSNRYRDKTLFAETVHDFSSNDYLGLAEKKELLTNIKIRWCSNSMLNGDRENHLGDTRYTAFQRMISGIFFYMQMP